MTNITIAEIKGKLASGNLERSEDLLTSDVFSACKYLHPQTLLIPFLSKARHPTSNESLEERLESFEITEARFRFWPTLSHSVPDCLIAMRSDAGLWFLVLIEAKYMSTKASMSWSEDEMEIARTPKDQLAREAQDLICETHQRFNIPNSLVRNRVLVYVTADKTMPKGHLSESIREVQYFTDAGDAVFWLSWYDMYSVVDRAYGIARCWEHPILCDLHLLLNRKQLRSFEGFQCASLDNLASPVYMSSHTRPNRRVSTYDFRTEEIGKLEPVYQAQRLQHQYYQTIESVPHIRSGSTYQMRGEYR